MKWFMWMNFSGWIWRSSILNTVGLHEVRIHVGYRRYMRDNFSISVPCARCSNWINVVRGGRLREANCHGASALPHAQPRNRFNPKKLKFPHEPISRGAALLKAWPMLQRLSVLVRVAIIYFAGRLVKASSFSKERGHRSEAGRTVVNVNTSWSRLITQCELFT